MKQIKGSKMKIAKKNIVKKQIMKAKKSKAVVKPKKEQVLVVAQEIKFATLLSGNEKKTRDRALKTLKKWLLNCFQRGYEFKEGDFTRIWKGLFYAVWMSDKPLVQEELCESIAELLDVFPAERLPQALLLAKVGLKVLASEWFGIDQHRMDKYLMLVRRWARAGLRCVRRAGWAPRACRAYAAMLSDGDGLLAPKTPLYARNATSMLLHFTDCFLEELAKVSEGDIPEESVAELMRPFCVSVCCAAAPAVAAAARRLLTALLKQSEPALEYRHRTIAWERMGCPEGGPDALQPASDDSGDEHNDSDEETVQDSVEKPLDPRAGRVDVELAPLPVPGARLAGTLRALLPAAAGRRAQRRARICLQRFEALARSEWPLPVAAPSPSPAPPAAPAAAAAALASLEKRLASECDELALRGLSRKHRKRVLARRRAGESVVGDVTPTPAAPTPAAPAATNGDWRVEETEPQPKRKAPDTSNKENVNKAKKNKNKREHVDAELAQDHDRMKKTKNKVNEAKVRQKQQNEFNKKVKNKGESSDIVESNATKDLSNSSQSVIRENFKRNHQKQQGQAPQKNENNKNWKKQKNNSNNSNNNQNIDNNKNWKKQKNNSNNNQNIDNNTIITNGINTASKKSKNMQKVLSNAESISLTPKKVKFVLKNNSMQGPVDYYRSVRQSPSIPFDSKKQPSKTNLKPSTPSPINPFLKKKIKLKN